LVQRLIVGLWPDPSRLNLPSEVMNTDEFIGLSESALECRVKRSQEIVKLKLRTPSRLYTHKVKVERADDVIRRLKCEIVEV
jgi:hypothetical protein